MSLIDMIKAKNAAAMAAKGTPVAGSVAGPPPASPPAVTLPASNPMDVLKKIQTSQASQAQQTPATQPAVVAPVVVAPVDDRPKAPWHFPGCVACGDNVYGGFNTKGSACVVCDAQSEQHGELKSIDYTWDYDAENNLVFTPVPGAIPTFPEKAVEAPVEVPAEPVKVKTRKPRTKKQKADPVEVAVESQTVTTPIVESLTEQAVTQTANGGFKLLIGCTFFKKVTGDSVTADSLLAEVIQMIEQTVGKPSAEIEHFALMQAIDALMPDITKDLASTGAWVVSFQPTKGTALARLVDGLRQHADMVIVNIGA